MGTDLVRKADERMSGVEVKEDPHAVAQVRVAKLQERIQPYLDVHDQIETGFTAAERIGRARERMLSLLGATQADWDNWTWQTKQRHLSMDTFGEILNLSQAEREVYRQAQTDSVVSVSPYYLSLIDTENPRCPIRLQAVPDEEEYETMPGSLDPSGEIYSSPHPGWVQRYPDRGILLVNDIGVCPVACRFCQRRHNLSPMEPENHNPVDIWGAIEYIRRTPSIRDVLLTGGDALMLSDNRLERVLRELRTIPHVEIIRLGTRLPVTMPQRVTPELCDMLARYGVMGGHSAIWVVTHFNHPIEVTPESAKAIRLLLGHGMPIVNQSVLLKGVNDHPYTITRLNQELLRIGVKPYCLFHCKSVDGATHFRTPVETGVEIVQYMNGNTSGLALPFYIVSLPGGKGKVRLITSEQLKPGEKPGTWYMTSWEGGKELYDEH